MMNSNYCPLGLECVIDERVSIYGHKPCINSESCYRWTTAWELPYWRDYNGLIVSFVETYNHLQSDLSENPITSEYDWRKYFAEYGFAEAVALPYFSRDDKPRTQVYITEENICKQELSEAGYANSITLPISRKTEYYSDDSYEGFDYWEVDLYFCDDEAINALNAGYANAVVLLSHQTLDDQRWEYGFYDEDEP